MPGCTRSATSNTTRPRRLLAAGHRHFRPGIRRHARHRSRPRPSFARYVCELRFHLRLSGRGTRSDGRPGHFDALPAHHCLRLYHRHENQGWLRQAARFRTGVHHGLPGVHRGRRHHAGDSSDRSDPALYGGRRLQSDRQLYSRDPAHHHLELGQCARAGADLGYVPVRGFGRAAQQGT